MCPACENVLGAGRGQRFLTSSTRLETQRTVCRWREFVIEDCGQEGIAGVVEILPLL